MSRLAALLGVILFVTVTLAACGSEKADTPVAPPGAGQSPPTAAPAPTAAPLPTAVPPDAPPLIQETVTSTPKPQAAEAKNGIMGLWDCRNGDQSPGILDFGPDGILVQTNLFVGVESTYEPLSQTSLLVRSADNIEKVWRVRDLMGDNVSLQLPEVGETKCVRLPPIPDFNASIIGTWRGGDRVFAFGADGNFAGYGCTSGKYRVLSANAVSIACSDTDFWQADLTFSQAPDGAMTWYTGHGQDTDVRLERIPAIPDLASAIKGLWIAENEGDDPPLLEFTSDGYCSVSNYIGTHTAIGPNLVQCKDSFSSNVFNVAVLSTSADTLDVCLDECSQNVKLRRMAGAENLAERIVGLWRPEGASGSDLQELEFAADGRIIVFPSGEIYNYRVVSDNTILFEGLPGKPSPWWILRFTDDTFEMAIDGFAEDETEHFLRVQP